MDFTQLRKSSAVLSAKKVFTRLNKMVIGGHASNGYITASFLRWGRGRPHSLRVTKEKLELATFLLSQIENQNLNSLNRGFRDGKFQREADWRIY